MHQVGWMLLLHELVKDKECRNTSLNLNTSNLLTKELNNLLRIQMVVDKFVTSDAHHTQVLLCKLTVLWQFVDVILVVLRVVYR